MELAVALDPECGDLKIRDPGVPSAPDLGATAAEPIVEEQGAAGLIGQEWREGSIIAEQDHLLGGLLRIGFGCDAERLEGRSQGEHSAAQGDILGLEARRRLPDAQEDQESCQTPRRNPHRSWFSRPLGKPELRLKSPT
jgi:hypothetical protein